MFDIWDGGSVWADWRDLGLPWIGCLAGPEDLGRVGKRGAFGSPQHAGKQSGREFKDTGISYQTVQIYESI